MSVPFGSSKRGDFMECQGYSRPDQTPTEHPVRCFKSVPNLWGRAWLVSWLAGRCTLWPSRFPSGFDHKALSALQSRGRLRLRVSGLTDRPRRIPISSPKAWPLTGEPCKTCVRPWVRGRQGRKRPDGPVGRRAPLLPLRGNAPRPPSRCASGGDIFIPKKAKCRNILWISGGNGPHEGLLR